MTTINNDLIGNEEILKLCKNEKITSPLMTKFEYSNIKSIRLTQLSEGAIPFIDDDEFSNIEDIVDEEIKQNKLPFIIERKMPNGVSEFWDLADMVIRN